MYFILSGLNADADENRIREGFAPYFSVAGVRLVREGGQDSPWALVEVADSYEKVWAVSNRLRGVYHRGKRLQFYIPAHQPEAHLAAMQADEVRIDLD